MISGAIAFIGLGVMGRPMAQHLRDSGYEVLGIDVTEQARQAFVGAIAPSEADLTQVDYVITMLPEGSHVQAVYEGYILPSVKSNCVLLDCSTVDVATSRRINQLAMAKGCVQVDAPVSGGAEAAGKGLLSFMVGGSKNHYAKALPLLQVMGAKYMHFGDSGSGQAAKASHNMICGITAMAVMEGFALAQALGLDEKQFYQLCNGAAAQSWTLENRCPIPGIAEHLPASNDYAPGFAARLMAKDLRLAQQAAILARQDTPFGAAAADAFNKYTQATGGELDFSAYFSHLRPHQHEDS